MDQYTGTDTKAKDGDQDGDWTKRDKIIMEDETTSMKFLVTIWLWLYILANLFGKYFLKLKKMSNTICIAPHAFMQLTCIHVQAQISIEDETTKDEDNNN